MKPHLVVIDGGLKPESDPQRADEWNRDWSPGQHAGTTFTTGSAHVDEINARPRRGLKVFVGGSRTITDRGAIACEISQLPRDAVVLTSRTHGASAAARDAALDQRLQLQVWTARVEEFPTKEAAYFARDEELIRSADCVIEFWDGKSSGTAHELDYARKLGKPVDLVVLPIDRPLRRPVKASPSDPYPGGDAA
jgi:hypothetical protein